MLNALLTWLRRWLYLPRTTCLKHALPKYSQAGDAPTKSWKAFRYQGTQAQVSLADKKAQRRMQLAYVCQVSKSSRADIPV